MPKDRNLDGGARMNRGSSLYNPTKPDPAVKQQVAPKEDSLSSLKAAVADCTKKFTDFCESLWDGVKKAEEKAESASKAAQENSRRIDTIDERVKKLENQQSPSKGVSEVKTSGKGQTDAGATNVQVLSDNEKPNEVILSVRWK